MSEKKYYVKLKNTYKHDERLLSLNKVSGKIDFVDWSNSGAWWKGTKSELGKIMGGAIYKGCVLPDGHEFSSDCKPWINPLIELVPVEDGE
ncbi:hypothetical protein [Lactococcus lactis]|uniref:hypothetical protein n=1 Tax=Lactococcus lactis TaxID=1358 RepID=UPI00265B4D65|nr:hypothetical protein [Lactococcus lactis]WKG34479.1 hypothetical protein QZH48_09145 [Lactococcus lactis subsp. lactis]WKG35945.1 hypothetical protein QZH48_04800 [Lactococcus lactis subsp. lactis]